MISVDVEHNTIPNNECLVIRSRGLNTATVNGIRRAMLLNVETYQFKELMDPADYHLITNMGETTRHCVLASTLSSQSIPVLAHRCSRLAIHLDSETKPLLESNDNRRVFFTIFREGEKSKKDENLVEDIKYPFENTTSLTRSFHSRDLKPVVYLREDEDWIYNSEESKRVLESIDSIFPYNELLVEVHYGQKVHVILRPFKGTGMQNASWSPCTFRYQFMADPEWKNHGGSVVRNGQIRRKIEGEKSFRHVFTHDPVNDQPYNRLGKPYGHILVFQYNGKMSPVTAFEKSIDRLTVAVDLFLKRYMESEREGSMMSKESTTVSSSDGKYSSTGELLHIPHNTQDKLSSDDAMLAGHTIGNLVTTKMLEILSEMITDEELWSQTNVSYKIPHPLIRQCQMYIQIPSALGISHSDLLAKAVTEIKGDLEELRSRVSGQI